MADKVFSEREGIRIAAEIERRGGTFYRRAAKLVREASMSGFLNRLAEEEAVHLREFQRLAETVGEDALPCDGETGAYLAAVAADIVFRDGLTGLLKAGLDDPRGVLEAAIRAEKDSILFYDGMIGAVRDAGTKRVFQDIVRQEKNHLTALQRLLDGQGGKDEGR